jgi:hypothetical protein
MDAKELRSLEEPARQYHIVGGRHWIAADCVALAASRSLSAVDESPMNGAPEYASFPQSNQLLPQHNREPAHPKPRRR